MSQKIAKKIRKQRKNDIVYLRECPDCGDFVEINSNDDFELMSAVFSGELVAISMADYKRLFKQEEI